MGSWCSDGKEWTINGHGMTKLLDGVRLAIGEPGHQGPLPLVRHENIG
jgi:hypothetical protein